MIPANRSSRSRRLRPVLVALEDRALLNASAHEIAKPVHIEAAKAATASAASIKLLDHYGAYKFTNFDGPATTSTTSTPIVTNINGISNSGTVVGFTIDAAGGFHNFTTKPTKSTKATSLPLNNSTAAMALGINKYGTVVGTDGNGNALALVDGKNLKTFLPTGSTSATALGINDRSTIVGQEVVGSESPGFIRLKGNKYITINAPSGPDTVNAQGINNNGLVVGFYVGTDDQDHGFIANQKDAKNGTITATAVADPTIPAYSSEPGATFVFSQILGVNDKGIAVGYYGDSTGSQHGFIYDTKTDQYFFIDDPAAAYDNGVVVTQVTGITNSGEISGFYTDANGIAHGFVATL